MSGSRRHRIPIWTLLTVIALIMTISVQNDDLLFVASAESVGGGTLSYVATIVGAAGALLGAAFAHFLSRRYRRSRSTGVRIRYRSSGSGPDVEYVVEGDVKPKDLEEILKRLAIDTQQDSDFTIVRLVNEIEQVGNIVLGRTDADFAEQKARRGSFQLRQELRQADIWSADDLRKFDRVMRLRSAVVHGDRHDAEELNAAIRDATQLLAALKAKRSPA